MLNTTKFPLIGGNLSLDFINTEIIDSGLPKDLLEGVADLAAWGLAAHLLDARKAARLVSVWSRQHDGVFKHVQAFRGRLRNMVAGLARGEAAGATVIEAINAELANKSGVVEIQQTASGFEKLFRVEVNEPRQLLAPIAESAADLLCYADLAHLKKCENPECILYFYDTTKNHSRRWCSMAGCGNRAKVAAFYQRKREKAKSGT